MQIDDFVKIDELCQNEVLWSNNLQTTLWTWWNKNEQIFVGCLIGWLSWCGWFSVYYVIMLYEAMFFLCGDENLTIIYDFWLWICGDNYLMMNMQRWLSV